MIDGARRLFLVALGLLGGLGDVSLSAAPPLVADLSDHLVAITTGFTGESVLLFGAIEGEGDIVVVVRGPAEDKSIWRKERKLGFWIGTGRASIPDAPSFYRVASTRPLEDIAPAALWQRYQIGLDHFRLPVRMKDRNATAEVYQQALLRLEERRNLYTVVPGRVDMLGENLFRTQIGFPANVPVGIYSVEVYLVRNGVIVGAQTAPLSISKIGIGADIYDFAHEYSALYGLLCVFLAVATGWLAAVLLKRN